MGKKSMLFAGGCLDNSQCLIIGRSEADFIFQFILYMDLPVEFILLRMYNSESRDKDPDCKNGYKASAGNIARKRWINI